MTRLHHLAIEGFRSVRKVSLELRELNILIGANGSGKSNLIGALGLLGDLVDNQLQLHIGRRGGANAILHFGSKLTKQLRVHAQFGSNEYEAVLEPAAGDTLIFAREIASFRGEGDFKEPYDENFGSGHKESALDDAAAEEPNRVADHVLRAMRG